MHGDAGPGKALHVGHFRAFINAGLVIDLALKNGEDSSGGFLSFSSCADSGTGDLYAVAVSVEHLVVNGTDDEKGAFWGAFGMPFKLSRF